MVRQHDDLGRLLLVIQIYVPVGLRVLVGADRTRGRWRRLVRRDYPCRYSLRERARSSFRSAAISSAGAKGGVPLGNYRPGELRLGGRTAR